MSSSTALVLRDKSNIVSYSRKFVLVDEETRFDTREEVKKHLPEICGRVLARAWIDKEFFSCLEKDALQTFNDLNVYLPENMSIEFKQGLTRASIVIYEQTGKLKLRTCSLELTMMARR
jgi:hypothetical protein